MFNLNLREMDKQNFNSLRRSRISWGSVFAGVVTVLAISLLFSVLVTSIGFFQFDPLSEKPTSGIGTTVGIISGLSLLISLAAGGFVAGKLAGADGMIHGFMVWGTTLIVTLMLLISLASGAVKLSANVLGSVSSAVGSVFSGVGSAVGGGLSGLADEVEAIFSDVNLEESIDQKELSSDLKKALKKSGIEELQPEYLHNQMNAVKSDLQATVKKLVKNPKNADQTLNEFLDRLSTRSDKVFGDIDRDELTKAIANNTDMSKAEVEKAVDEYEEILNNSIAEGKEQIENLKQTLSQAKQDWEELKVKTLEEVDNASNAAGKSTLISFFALIIGGAVAVYAGAYGVGKTKEGLDL